MCLEERSFESPPARQRQSHIICSSQKPNEQFAFNEHAIISAGVNLTVTMEHVIVCVSL